MTDDQNPPAGQGAPPPRRSGRQGVGGSPIGSTLSIVLAVVAVIIGFLILNNITDDDGSSGGDTATTTETTVSGTVAQTTTTTTIPPLVTEGATVIVANASGVPGSAGRMSDELAGQGFTMGDATNSTTGQQEQSVVYYDPGIAAAQDVADSVARVMGELSVETVPAPPPVDGGSLNGAGVLVMLGTAQADQTIADLAVDTVVTAPEVSGGSTPGTDAVTATTAG